MLRLNEITQIVLLFATTGCSRPPLCNGDNCNDVAPEGEETPPLDLPCGGADLMTDDANCGVCANACDVVWPESPYSSGHCVDGECGPSFEQCSLFGENITCKDFCQSSGGRTCIPRGCPGVQNEWVTALIYYPGMTGECLPEPPQEESVLGCDDPLPFTVEYDSRVSCCCL